MRHKSKKRARLDRELAPHLEAYKAEFPKCQVCNRRAGVEIHEVVRGPARMKARARRATIMHVCRKCHDLLTPEVFLWQLARKYAAHDGCFDLDAALDVKGWAPGAVTIEEVQVVAAGFGWEKFNTKGSKHDLPPWPNRIRPHAPGDTRSAGDAVHGARAGYVAGSRRQAIEDCES